MSVIDTFVEQYKQQSTEYEKIKDKALEYVRKMLNDAGIMAISSGRVKKCDRLREKLLDRNREKHYTTSSDIIKDIPDFIGLRIALYFPDDQKKIDALLPQIFIVEKIKNFPTEQRKYDNYNRRFAGYCATHYRVRLKEAQNQILGNPIIEIQVGSVLMHAWAEVEHDLAYKTKKGIVSYGEYETLDEINGLVITGEIALQRLQRLSMQRIEQDEKCVDNHYQLAAFLYEKVFAASKNESLILGDVESLFKLYEKENRLTIKKIENDLKKVDLKGEIAVAQQLIDLHTDKSFANTKYVFANKLNMSSEEIKEEYGTYVVQFLQKWITLERMIREICSAKGFQVSSSESVFKLVKKYEIIPEYIREEYNILRKVRNDMVHGGRVPVQKEMDEYMGMLNSVLGVMEKKYSEL